MYLQFEGKRVVFVFGSNLAGVHGAGAAAYARRHYGAIVGRGIGIQNQSYAIPTKDWDIYTPLSLERINFHVKTFLDFALTYEVADRGVVFRVTAIGTGKAGYKHEQIAPMFVPLPANCYLPSEWKVEMEKIGVMLPGERYLRR